MAFKNRNSWDLSKTTFLWKIPPENTEKKKSSGILFFFLFLIPKQWIPENRNRQSSTALYANKKLHTHWGMFFCRYNTWPVTSAKCPVLHAIMSLCCNYQNTCIWGLKSIDIARISGLTWRSATQENKVRHSDRKAAWQNFTVETWWEKRTSGMGRAEGSKAARGKST